MELMDRFEIVDNLTDHLVLKMNLDAETALTTIFYVVTWLLKRGLLRYKY